MSTLTARLNAAALGLDVAGMIAVVAALAQHDFYKSMTMHADQQIGQDVYRPKTQAGDIYLKLTDIDDVLIVSLRSYENAVSSLWGGGTSA